MVYETDLVSIDEYDCRSEDMEDRSFRNKLQGISHTGLAGSLAHSAYNHYKNTGKFNKSTIAGAAIASGFAAHNLYKARKLDKEKKKLINQVLPLQSKSKGDKQIRNAAAGLAVANAIAAGVNKDIGLNKRAIAHGAATAALSALAYKKHKDSKKLSRKLTPQ